MEVRIKSLIACGASFLRPTKESEESYLCHPAGTSSLSLSRNLTFVILSLSKDRQASGMLLPALTHTLRQAQGDMRFNEGGEGFAQRSGI
ncbi:hypothetical protein [Ekhidna sp.]|uniref:hypothetical protein n=1 Tax=Ekhidna sp. TaxID=2608089 RepID=UPI00355A3D26